jgi:hypothetical protein
MAIDGDKLQALVERELAGLLDERVVEHIRGLLVEPHVVLRIWDYGEPGQQYPCWIVLQDTTRRQGGAIAYCEYGFGPCCPWGLISLGDEEKYDHMGTDSGWFRTFLDAFFDSFAATELPIWRVFKTAPDGTRTPLTEESTWAATWAQIEALRSSDLTARYDCDQSLYGY